MKNGMVAIEGFALEECICGSRKIKVVKEGLPPGKKIMMHTIRCEQCGKGPEIYTFTDRMDAHVHTWNSFMSKRKRG